MASERARSSRFAVRAVLSLAPVLTAALLPTFAMAAGPAALSPATTLIPAPPAHAWWERVGLAGRQVTAAQVDDGLLVVWVAGGGRQLSRDGGAHFVPVRAGGFAGPRPSCPPHLRSPEPLVVCAAPASLPGVIIGVDPDGGVWRRTTAGAWSRSLILLPQGGLHLAPRVTAIAAFESAGVSDTVYLGTDGYSVLETVNAGDDWLRGGPGLPDRVLALATDSRREVIYAGTADGLWRHHLQALPAPPRYPAADLRSRRLATALVSLLAIGTGLAGLRALLRPDPVAGTG
ncbi:MAG: hypothetical protein ABR541_09360 [Candidatus Dormibacteria bacterium]